MLGFRHVFGMEKCTRFTRARQLRVMEGLRWRIRSIRKGFGPNIWMLGMTRCCLGRMGVLNNMQYPIPKLAAMRVRGDLRIVMERMDEEEETGEGWDQQDQIELDEQRESDAQEAQTSNRDDMSKRDDVSKRDDMSMRNPMKKRNQTSKRDQMENRVPMSKRKRN
jgi:hypothetical protein